MPNPPTTSAKYPALSRGFTRYSLLWLLALGVRLFFLWQISSTDVFNLVMGDGIRYDAWAQEIAKGNWLGHGVFYQAPLYPYFLGLVYTMAGRSFLVLRVMQAMIGATSCVLLACAGSRFFSRNVGLVAGVLLALYPTAIFLDYAIQKSVLDMLFTCGLLAVLGRIKQQSEGWWWALAGVLLGLLALTRENAIVFLPIIVSWLFAAWPGELWVKRLRWTGCFSFGLGVVLLPVAFRNQLVGGEFHLTTAQAGPNFYIGNSQFATGVYRPLVRNHESEKYEQGDANALAEQALGRKLSPGEVSQYWMLRAVTDIRSHPLRWCALMAQKFRLLWNVSEISDTDDQYTYAEWSWLLRTLNYGLNFGTLVPLGIFGVGLMWLRGERPWLLYGMFFAYAASVMLFYIFARYRFPLVPFLLLFLCGGLAGLREAWRSIPRPSLVFLGGVALAAALICNRPLKSEQETRGTTHYNIGADLLDQTGDRAGALRNFDSAIRLRPDFAPFHHARARLYSDLDRGQEAIDDEMEAVRLYPRYAEAHCELAVLLAQKGKWDEAITEARSAVQLDPTSEKYQAVLDDLEKTRRGQML